MQIVQRSQVINERSEELKKNISCNWSLSATPENVRKPYEKCVHGV